MPKVAVVGSITATRVDRATLGRLKALAGDRPVAQYLRELSITLYEAKEREILSAEIRKLGEEAGVSKKVTEVMLGKASLHVLRDQVTFLRDRVAHPERDREFYRREAVAMAASKVGVNAEELEALMIKLSGLSKESLTEVIKVVSLANKLGVDLSQTEGVSGD